MDSPKTAGRIIGVALLAQTLLAPVVNFGLVRPGTARDFLVSAAGSALQVRFGLLVAFGAGLLTVAMAAIAWPWIRRTSESLAVAYALLSVVGVVAVLGEGSAVRDMLALSLDQASRASENLAAVGDLARASWVSAHYLNLTISMATMLFLYAILLRTALVPRWLSLFGIAAAAVSTTVGAGLFLGFSIPLGPMASIGIANLSLVFWLLARGFADRRESRGPTFEFATA